MIEQELTSPASPRPRVALRLVPSLPPDPLPPPGERVLLEVDGLKLTRESLEVGGRSYRLTDIRCMGTRHRAPRLWPSLLVAGLGAVLGGPVLLARPGSLAVYAAIAVVGALVFSSVLWVTVAEDTYWLTIQTAEGERQVLRSHEHQRFARVVAALGEALGASRLESLRARAR
ncbi:DUF6232 family protein [Myxococcaceae bacterium GXIMD 01537]